MIVSTSDLILGIRFALLLTRESRYMENQRNYWVCCFLVWGILPALAAAKATNGTFHNVLLVFAGWTLCWDSATIARFVYLPPKRWLQRNESPAP